MSLHITGLTPILKSSCSIPIPEGLAPLSPSLFDAHLTRLIETYTLNGIHVLVHCRGGVGRAGLVACCWMLRLGLCGWLPSEGRPVGKRNVSGAQKVDRNAQEGLVTTTPTAPTTTTMDIDSPTSASQTPDDGTTEVEKEGDWSDGLRRQGVRKDALALVERVIAVTRRRRSLKAVETYEQVKFLVAYVEFLRARGKVVGEERVE